MADRYDGLREAMKDADKDAVIAFAESGMKLTRAADLVGVDYRVLASRLDYIYKRTKLNPRNVYDLYHLALAAREASDDRFS